jgi:hypothetical protein
VYWWRAGVEDDVAQHKKEAAAKPRSFSSSTLLSVLGGGLRTLFLIPDFYYAERAAARASEHSFETRFSFPLSKADQHRPTQASKLSQGIDL